MGWKFVPQLNVSRVVISRKRDEPFSEGAERLGISIQWCTIVRERKGHPPSTPQYVLHFHHWKSRRDLPTGITHNCNKWAIAIALGQQLNPGRVMKDVGVGKALDKVLPPNIIKIERYQDDGFAQSPLRKGHLVHWGLFLL
jgi:hypothetical protein